MQVAVGKAPDHAAAAGLDIAGLGRDVRRDLGDAAMLDPEVERRRAVFEAGLPDHEVECHGAARAGMCRDSANLEAMRSLLRGVDRLPS